MITPFNITNNNLVKILNDQYGLSTVNLTFLPKGEASWCYIVEAKNGKFFLKIHKAKNLSPNRFQLLHDLHTKASIQNIIYPTPTSDGKLETKIDDYPTVLFNFTEGKTALDTKFNNMQYEALGKLLAQIHQSKIDYPQKEDFSIPSKGALLKTITLLNQSPPESAVKEAWDLLVSAKEEIENKLAEAERLSSQLKNANINFVVCHGEPSPGNIMANKEGDVYLIDWDEPILAPKEKDLMFFGKTMEAFMRGYRIYSADTTINTDVVSFYKHLWNINEVVDFGERLLLNNASDDENTHNLKQFKHFLDYSGLRKS